MTTDGVIAVTRAIQYTLKAGKSNACILARAVMCRHLWSSPTVGQRISIRVVMDWYEDPPSIGAVLPDKYSLFIIKLRCSVSILHSK